MYKVCRIDHCDRNLRAALLRGVVIDLGAISEP
jgi:hypothetical protein